MSNLLSNDVLAIKNIFPFIPYCLRSFTTVNSYEEIIHIINTFFEINQDYFEILTFGKRKTDTHYYEKDKILVETTIEVKCKPIIDGPLDEFFIQYCGENKDELLNQYKEAFNKALQEDELERNALEFHIYIRECTFICGGKESTVNLVEFNYITKIKTKLFDNAYKKMKEIFSAAEQENKYKILMPNKEQYKINYSGEPFEEVRIKCLLPFIKQ